MLRGIEFKAERFETKDDNNLLYPLTANTIIICADWKSMNSLSKEMLNTVNEEAEYNDYDCDVNDVGQAKFVLNFGLQKIIDINGQRITLALEPAAIYKANRLEDIWFFDWGGGLAGIEYKESIYPMTIFKGSDEVWNCGLDEVYKTICNGRYGTYDGSWVDLECEDYRKRNCL